MAGGGRRGLIPTDRNSQGAGKGGERAEGAPEGTTLHVGVLWRIGMLTMKLAVSSRRAAMRKSLA